MQLSVSTLQAAVGFMWSHAALPPMSSHPPATAPSDVPRVSPNTCILSCNSHSPVRSSVPVGLDAQ